jgi:hypothetical protein
LPEGCSEGPSTVELLLPVEKNSDTEVTFASVKPRDEQLLVNDKYVGQPVKIIFYSPSKDKEINIDKDMALMISSYNWSGYPSVVIVGFKKDGSYINNLAYRIAPETDDCLVRNFTTEINKSKKWPCTKNLNKVAEVILTPFTLVLDIITAPVQFLVAVVIICIYGM